MSDDAVKALREALQFSPDNVRLRQHLAQTLLQSGNPAEAEIEFRQALSQVAANSPLAEPLKLGLATAYVRQVKLSHALVILEDLAQHEQASGAVLLFFAKLLADTGDESRAAREYRRAIEADPELIDETLADRLGVSHAKPTEEEDPEECRQRVAWEVEGSSGPTAEIERPKIRFADVGGMDGVKDEIRMKIILPLTHADMFKAYGKSSGGGILMYGPPGCGKTLLARATAGEIDSKFLAVGISDVLDMWIGNSEKNLHELFDQGRRNKPCVMFFDEVDALGGSRTDLKHSGARHLVNQFLSELDGVQSNNDGLLVLAATNAPWHLDSAFRRPGRFDRILFVPPPDQPARAAILKLLCLNKPLEKVDFDQVAKQTAEFSGADLKAVVDLAVEAKLREAIRDGVPKPILTKDLLTSARSVKPSTREWFATARNYALYSNQGGQYDDILKYLKM